MDRAVTISEVTEVGSIDLSMLDIYSCYQTMPFCRADIKESLFRQDLKEALSSGGFCQLVLLKSHVIAVAAIKPLAWDSAHFGLPMGQLYLSASVERCPRRALEELLKQSIDKAQKSLGICHISIETDMDHYHCLNPMLALGFEIMDVKRYFHTTDMQGFKVPRFLSQVRDYEPTDFDKTMRMVERVNIKSRFTRDEFLPPEKTREMYRIWLSNFLQKQGSDVFAYVFERHGNMEGCSVISKKYFPWLKEPVEFMDKGLYVSDRKGVGGFAPALYKSIERALAQDGVVQTCTSLNNSASIRVLEQWNTHPHVSAYALRLYLK
jgi:hypothetical protein